MADNDLTIVILRNIQAELATHRERFDAIDKRFDAVDGNFAVVNHRIDSLRDQMMHQFAHLDSRISTVEDIAIKTATSLGIEA